MRIWQRLGGEIAIITGRTGMSLRHRMNELGIRHIINGSQDKARDFTRLCETLLVRPEETAMLADDLPDLSVLRRCGYPMAVQNAAVEVRAAARFVTSRTGGHGAVREAIEHLLEQQGRWSEALRLFDPSS